MSQAFASVTKARERKFMVCFLIFAVFAIAQQIELVGTIGRMCLCIRNMLHNSSIRFLLAMGHVNWGNDQQSLI